MANVLLFLNFSLAHGDGYMAICNPLSLLPLSMSAVGTQWACSISSKCQY